MNHERIVPLTITTKLQYNHDADVTARIQYVRVCKSRRINITTTVDRNQDELTD